MIIPSSKPNSKDETITIKSFKGGTNSLVDEARLNTQFAKESVNLIQVQDGLWKTRWGTQNYGAELPANPDGGSEYVKSDGTTELVSISNGVAYKSTDGGSWSAISGATFTAGVQCYFMQIASYLYISNGTDPLSRYNGSVLTTYTQIAAPTSLAASLVASGLSSGTHAYYGVVTALNAVGETVGSTEASIVVNKLRDNWIAGTDKINWHWNSVATATRYQLYISDQSGYETLLTDSEVTNFDDDGSLAINPYIEVPNDNTTGAPLFKSMVVSGNRIWATNNDNDMYKVYFSGTGQYIGNFSDFYGGGWINLEKGGKEIPVTVVHYQSGGGDARATVLAKTSNGRGAVWQLQITTATVGDTSFSVPSATKIVGSVGTESILGVVSDGNNIVFPNRKGWFSLGPEKQYYGILRTNELSSNIRPYWRSLVGSEIKNICAYFYDAKVFISVPTTSTGNDKIIVCSPELGNSWAVDWSVGAKQFLEYTDSSNVTHFLYIPTTGTKLVELSENFLDDNGTVFNQSYVSPLIPVSEIKTDILNLRESIVELGRPQGVVKFQILGIGKDSAFTTLATKTITNFGSNTGIGTDLVNELMPSSTQSSVSGGAGLWAIYLLDAPSVFTQATTKGAIKKRAKVYYIQFKVYSTTASTDFTILSLQAKGRLVRRRLPSTWIN